MGSIATVGAIVWVQLEVKVHGATVMRRFKAQVIEKAGGEKGTYRVRLESDGSTHWVPWTRVSLYRPFGGAR